MIDHDNIILDGNPVIEVQGNQTIGHGGNPQVVVNGAQGQKGDEGNDGVDGLNGIIPFIGTPISGRHYPVVGYGFTTAFTTLAFSSNQIDLCPMVLSREMTPLGIGAVVTSFAIGSQFKILVYSSNMDGWPDTLLWSSESLAASSNVYRESTTSIPTFTKGTVYWVGFHSVGTATMRRTPLANSMTIGGIGTTATGTTLGTIIRRSGVSYPTPPTTWNFTDTEITNNIAPPFILFRF